MKNKTIFILVMVVLFLAGSASADLVGYWTLDEPFKLRVADPPWNYDFPRAEDYRDGDPAGNAARPNDGWVTSSVVPIIPGKVDTIHYIDFQSNEYDGGAIMIEPSMGLTYVDCGSSTTSSLEWNDPNWADITAEITVAAWVKADEVGSWPSHRGIVTKSAIGGGSGWALYRTDIVWYDYVYCPECPTPNYGLTFYVGVDGMPGLHSWFSSEQDIVSFWNGDWHYVVGTYNGSKAVIYIDGVENNSIDCSGPIATNDWDVWIGNWASDEGSSGHSWRGGIDDVRVYDEALSAEEVYDLYLEGVGVYYVDDDAPGDPGPDDYTISDPLEDGSEAHPFDLIREAIEAAQNGDIVMVADGTYPREGSENDPVVDFIGKAITVRSENGPQNCILSGGEYVVDFSSGETHTSVLSGFTVRDSDPGSGIRCYNSSATIMNNIITSNWSEYGNGSVWLHNSSAILVGNVIAKNVMPGPSAGIYCCDGTSATIVNNTIVGNGDDYYGSNSGIYCENDSTATVTNCISYDNGDYDFYNCSTTYSCLEHGAAGTGNIDSDPLFADPCNGDYHLLSEYGRHVPQYGLWSFDDVSSPCIDAGDPSVDPQSEGVLNGGRINMGAYGGTAYASKSLWYLKGDLNRDGKVDFFDFAMLANEWRDTLPWVQ